QLRFLGTIAPVEILIGAERRRALQLVIVDVEFIGFEFRAVTQPAPRQWKQAGSHTEETAEAQPPRRILSPRPCRSSAVRCDRSCRRSAAAPQCPRHDRSRSADAAWS